MSTEALDRTDSRPSRGGRRRSGRGGRSRGNRNRSSSNQNNNRSKSEPKKPEKKSFWQSVVGFFKGDSPEPEKKPASRSRNSSTKSSDSKSKPKQTRSKSSVRKPEKVEVTSPRLYVGNLSFDATESDLEELFAGTGQVQSAEVVCNKHTHRSKGFAFVELTSIDEAKHAVETLHDQEYMGRKLVVSGAKAPPEKSSSDRNGAERQPEQ